MTCFIYIENPKDSTKNLLYLINEFMKVEKYKINIKNQQCFYTLTMNYLKKNPVCTSTNKKYLRINVSKDMKDL